MGLFLGLVVTTQASEADLVIPDLHEGTFHIFGTAITSWDFLFLWCSDHCRNPRVQFTSL